MIFTKFQKDSCNKKNDLRSMEKKKIIILQSSLMQYRVPTWNILADKYDLTIGYFDKGLPKDCEKHFKVHKFGSRKFGPFIFIFNLRNYLQQFDVVCFVPDPHIPSFVVLPFLPHKYKLLTWSIGFRCSYTHPYLVDRKHTIMDRVVYQWIFNKVDANIFYMKNALAFWRDNQIDKNRVFVAPNTTDVEPIDLIPKKKTGFLFVGTLYRGKGIEFLIESFKNAINKTGSDVKLTIVGNGEMRNELENYVVCNNLENNVEFTGAIYDETLLATHFQKALLCISPTQGGLSCPKSMGYGVPFVCRRDAITGGEIHHMTDGVNGIMYDSNTDLDDILVDAINNPSKYVEMGVKAKHYYDNNATPKHMAQGVTNAIEFTLN